MTGAPPSRPGPGIRTGRVVRALFAGFDLVPGSGTHVAVPGGIPW